MTFFKYNFELCDIVVQLELVSKELNYLAAILHVYAGVWILWSKKKNVIIFQKENGNTFNHSYSEKSSKREICYYDPQIYWKKPAITLKS